VRKALEEEGKDGKTKAAKKATAGKKSAKPRR
jgi:hypothetical protein